MDYQYDNLSLMPLSGAQRQLLIAMRVFLGLIAVLAIHDFAAALGA
jgi:hypothetical protein